MLEQVFKDKWNKACLLNPESRYVKIDANLVQFLCHMTSDVKFLHMPFFLIYIVDQKCYKRTFTVKQILIVLEAAVQRCSQKAWNFIK